MASSQRTELRHEMRIGQEPHVEHQIGIVGHAVFESEADAGDENSLLCARGSVLKAVGQVRAQFVNVEFRGVDDEVSDRADGAQMAPFGRQGSAYGSAGSEGMRTARLAESAEQDWIARFEINDARRNHALD